MAIRVRKIWEKRAQFESRDVLVQVGLLAHELLVHGVSYKIPYTNSGGLHELGTNSDLRSGLAHTLKTVASPCFRACEPGFMMQRESGVGGGRGFGGCGLNWVCSAAETLGLVAP